MKKYLIILGICGSFLLVAYAHAATWTLTNDKSAYCPGAKSCSAGAYISALTNPSTIIISAEVGSNASTSFNTPTDTAGNTFTPIGIGNQNCGTSVHCSFEVFIAHNTHTTASDNVTITASTTGATGSTYMRISATEWTNSTGTPSVIDGYAQNTNATTGNGSSNNVTSNTTTTTQNGDLIYGSDYIGFENGTQSKGTGFTTSTSPTQYFIPEYMTQSTAGVASATWTETWTSAAAYAATMIALAPAPSPPNAPSADAPSNGAQGQSLTPQFKMTATDAGGYYLQYKVTIYSDSGCSTVVQTNDQTATSTGWSGQNASSSTEYTSGTQGAFTVQTALSAGTTYYWVANAIDPGGSDAWSASSSCQGFSTPYGSWTTGSGNWSISSNALTVTPAAGASAELDVTGQSQTNGVIEFEGESSGVGAGSGNIAGVVRASGTTTHYALTTGDFLNQQEAIGKLNSSAYTALATASFTFSGSTLYHFRGSISGTSLKSWLNGANALSTTDSALSASGNLGLVASSTNGSATFTFDDFAFYSSTIITINNLPSGGSWSVLNHSGTVISCQTGSTWDLSTYTGQVPISYDSGGGQIAIWQSNATCSGSSTAVYPSASGYATDIFGGDTYSYSATTTFSGANTETVSVDGAGAVSY